MADDEQHVEPGFTARELEAIRTSTPVGPWYYGHLFRLPPFTLRGNLWRVRCRTVERDSWRPCKVTYTCEGQLTVHRIWIGPFMLIALVKPLSGRN